MADKRLIVVRCWVMLVDPSKLRHLWEENVLSQRDLARMAGLTHATVWRLENGPAEAHPRTIRKLTKVLEVEPKDLIKKEE
jgi:transcriptional regulator with XRE-family HTH domain